MIYNIGIFLFKAVLNFLSLFDEKIRKGQKGRSETFKILNNKITAKDSVIWCHCASLGEYEQGLPVFKKIKERYPEHKIVLSFFSPSGYEVRKNNHITDIVVYLPIDTPKNSKAFVEILKPKLTVFVKYEIWPNYLVQLREKGLKSILISAHFRKGQIYFKWYGHKLRKALLSFDHIFVQDKNSKDLLKTIGYTNAKVSGDTRFDRVYSQLSLNNQLPWLQVFKGDSLLIVCGSSWPEDEKLILNYINEHVNEKVKFLIAPHEVDEGHINDISSKLKASYKRFTALGNDPLTQCDVIILDTIGQLSKAYSYANIAYIGGAVGKTGLHNILEAAVFGIPIITGLNIHKFPEALDLKDLGGLHCVGSYKELKQMLDLYLEDSGKRMTDGKINSEYVKEKMGAVIQITNSIRI